MKDIEMADVLSGKALLKDSSGNTYEIVKSKPSFRYVFRNLAGNTRHPLHGDNSTIELTWETLKLNPWYSALYCK